MQSAVYVDKLRQQVLLALGLEKKQVKADSVFKTLSLLIRSVSAPSNWWQVSVTTSSHDKRDASSLGTPCWYAASATSISFCNLAC